MSQTIDIQPEHRPAPVTLPSAVPRPTPKLRVILRTISELSGQSKEALIGRRRSHEVGRPRQLYMLLASELTGASLPQIARVIERDHGTIIHGIRSSQQWMRHDEKHRLMYEKAKARLLE